MHITSTQNPRIKEALKLQKRRERDRQGLFIIEGYRELMRASLGGISINTIFYCPELFLGENEEGLILDLGGEAILCSEAVFCKLSYRDRPDGLIAIAEQLRGSLQQLKGRKGLYLIAEAVEKPGNLGTILRSCDAAGVEGVIVCDRCTDIHNPNVVRASVGTLFTQPVVEASLFDTLQWLKEKEIALIAATPNADTLFTEADLKEPLAIAVGSEQYGLSAKIMDAATIKVRIPMMGKADSLNVASATTLLLYEALRQRGGA